LQRILISVLSMLVEGISHGPLTLQEVRLVFNTLTNLYDVELILNQLYSYGKYAFNNARIHYQENRICNHVLTSLSNVEDFNPSIANDFFEKNKNGIIYLIRSFDVTDILDSNEIILLNNRNQKTSRITEANKNYVGPYQDSLEFYLDKYVCLNETQGYEFYGLVGQYQYSKSYFSNVPKADVDFRIKVAPLFALIHTNSNYLNLNKQRLLRLTIELEEDRRSEMIELMTAKHYELTNHFNNIIAAVVLCGNPTTITEDLKNAGSFINASNKIQVGELAESFLMDPITVLEGVRKMGSAYFVAHEGRFQEALKKYIDTCFIITGFLFGAVNAGVRVGIDYFFGTDVSANDVISEVLCNIEYLNCERELIEDSEKREYIGKTLYAIREKAEELYISLANTI